MLELFWIPAILKYVVLVVLGIWIIQPVLEIISVVVMAGMLEVWMMLAIWVALVEDHVVDVAGCVSKLGCTKTGPPPDLTTMSTGTLLSCWSRACFAAVSAPTFIPAKKVEARITPNRRAAKRRQERRTLLKT